MFEGETVGMCNGVVQKVGVLCFVRVFLTLCGVPVRGSWGGVGSIEEVE